MTVPSTKILQNQVLAFAVAFERHAESVAVGRQTFIVIGLLAATLWTAAACSPEPEWSADEQENGRHFFLSLEAGRKAARRAHKADPDEPQLGVEKVNEYQKIALSEALLVRDAVLDKAHPELKRRFRSEYQQGLEMILKSYDVASSSDSGAPSGGQIQLQASGIALLKRWSDWFDAHRLEIKIPGQSSTQPG